MAGTGSAIMFKQSLQYFIDRMQKIQNDLSRPFPYISESNAEAESKVMEYAEKDTRTTVA